jgi:hypothetical protein
MRKSTLNGSIRAVAVMLLALSAGLSGAACGKDGGSPTGPVTSDPGSDPGSSDPQQGSWPGPAPVGQVAYAVDLSNNFLVFGSGSMDVLTAKMRITGLPILKRIIGIALRPSNGKLYGIGNDSRVYIIDPLTAEATPVAGSEFSPRIASMFDTHFAMDLEPTTERVRLIAAESGGNWSINLDDGTAILEENAVYGMGTPFEGRTPRLLGLAYPTLPDSARQSGWCANLAYAIDADEALMIASCDPASGKWWPTGAPPASATQAALRTASLLSPGTRVLRELKDQLMRCGEFMSSPGGSESPGEKEPPQDDRFFPSTPPTEFYTFLVDLGDKMNRVGVVKPIDTDPWMPGVTIHGEFPSAEPVQSVEWVSPRYVPHPTPQQVRLQLRKQAHQAEVGAAPTAESDPRASCN